MKSQRVDYNTRREVRAMVHRFFNALTVADWISISRLLLSSWLIFLLWHGEKDIFKWVLLIAFSTDIIDGAVARKLNISSVLGARLDSIADAYLVMVATISFCFFELGFVLSHLKVIVALFGLYALQLTLAYYRYGKPTSFHTYSAKTAALFQGVFFITSMFYQPMGWLFYSMVVISLLETLEEIILIYLLPTWQTDVKGLYWILNENNEL